MVCVLSVAAALAARTADRFPELQKFVPRINPEVNTNLLEIMASSMLVIATFAVGSMITAYGSASNTATPRSFPLIISDDTSQTALSSFIGAFIFSLVALVAAENSYYGEVGQFALFLLILLVFAWVVIMFVSWVDDIARLGRLGNTIDKVEAATSNSLKRRHRDPVLGGKRWLGDEEFPVTVASSEVGYVQQIDMASLQNLASKTNCEIQVVALPGKFVGPGQLLARLKWDDEADDECADNVAALFRIGDDRVFDEDPRFGLIVLAEIAGRALSPAVNDPGTAIDILGTFVRLFADWVKPLEDVDIKVKYDRVHVPELAVSDMVDDAFEMILREGAGSTSVAIRLQKAFASLATLDHPELRKAVMEHSSRALAQCEMSLSLDYDINAVRGAAKLVDAQE